MCSLFKFYLGFVVVLTSWEEEEIGFKNKLKEHDYAPWGYPDFQMEALNKLEHLVELAFMVKAKVEEVRGYSQEGMFAIVIRRVPDSTSFPLFPYSHLEKSFRWIC
ncbi:unnamed protein product [Dicrocoelium dendriticum]|nr:unnamed protein product [Dicrocoelium dendriticum]